MKITKKGFHTKRQEEVKNSFCKLEQDGAFGSVATVVVAGRWKDTEFKGEGCVNREALVGGP